ncbi:MAG: ABC transporter substrate-binding protein [Anaeromyxobacteraceae bacterium]
MLDPRRSLLAAALLLAACAKPEPVRLGLVSGLSGRHSDLGLSSRNGAVLATEELNAAGGVRGRPLELVVRDDRNDPEVARRAVEELVQTGVVAIVGHATSAMAEATLPILDRSGVLMVSPTVSATSFRGRDDGFVMLYPSNDLSARALVTHLTRAGGARRVSAILDLSNAAFTRTWLEAFREATEARGGRVVGEVPFTSGEAPAWGALVDAALAPKPDALLVLANAFDTAALAQQLRKRGSNVALLGSDWGFTSDALAHGGSAMEGALFTLKIDVTSDAPGIRGFRDAYRARFGRPPDFAAVLAAEAVQLLAAGLTEGADRRTLKAAVVGRTHHGLVGDVVIDASGDARREVYVMTVRDGRIERVR